MKKHIVTCVKCGRQFDANEGGAYYPESRRYVCKHCVDKQKDIQKEQAKARKAAEREAEADERKRDFKCIECGLTDEEAYAEASRCLRCDHYGYGIFRGGRNEKW